MHFVDLFQVKADLHNALLKKTINDMLVNGIGVEIDKMSGTASEAYLDKAFRTLKNDALEKVFSLSGFSTVETLANYINLIIVFHRKDG